MLDSSVYREALRASSADPAPDWVVPYSFLQQRELLQVVEHLHAGPQTSIIDLGCGLGGAALWIAERSGARVTGIDSSSEAIERAKERASNRGLEERSTWIVAEMTHTGLSAGAFDGVMSVDALMFAPPQDACDEIARLLRSGGRVALFAVEPASPPPGTFAVTDYRPYFERAGLNVDVHSPTPDWPRHRDRFFEALLERADRLREELGDAAEGILEEARAPKGPSRRVFLAATKV